MHNQSLGAHHWRMGTRDPQWLNGQRESPSQSYMWHSQNHRQFCVLPSYEDGNRTGRMVYAMWGRALSDGCFYPVPPTMYRLALELIDQGNGHTQTYQWVARTHGHLAYNIPVEMQEMVVEWQNNGGRFREPGPVAPGLVDVGFETEAAPTTFYPDRSLWSPELLEEEDRGEIPVGIGGGTAAGYVAPVAIRFDEIFRQVDLWEASTRRWFRGRERHPGDV